MRKIKINEIIKQRRIELGLTLKDVAKALNVAESTVSRYESSDIQNMGIDKIEALSVVLKCSPGYLMGWIVDEVNCQQTVSEKEKVLLSNYRKLNDVGKNKLIEYSDDLADSKKYIVQSDVIELPCTVQKEYEFETIAAHADDLTEEENNENLAMIKAFMAKEKKEHK